jgi:hypothetical protein
MQRCSTPQRPRCPALGRSRCAPHSAGWPAEDHPDGSRAQHLGLSQVVGCLDRDNPHGDLSLITDHLSSHTSGPICEWLAAHPHVPQVFIPVGACWLNLIEAWWRCLRRAAYAGQCFADRAEIALATRVATGQLNCHTHPWIWGGPHVHTACFVDDSSTTVEERCIRTRTRSQCWRGVAHRRQPARRRSRSACERRRHALGSAAQTCHPASQACLV